MWDIKWEVCRAKASKHLMKKKHYEKLWRSLLKHKTQLSCSDLFMLLQIKFAAIQPQMLVLIVRKKRKKNIISSQLENINNYIPYYFNTTTEST